MKRFFRFRLPQFNWPGRFAFRPGILAVLLAFGLAANTLLDADCVRIQTASCCCSSPDSALQDPGIQPGTCAHCTSLMPVSDAGGLPEVSTAGCECPSPVGRASSAPLPERPPISA